MAALGLAGCWVAARWIDRSTVTLPQCLFKEFTAIPCPTCGTTRSLIAFSKLDLVAALQFNPLLFLLILAVLGWLVSRLHSRIRGVAPSRARSERRPGVWIVAGIAFLVLNWVYLIKNLPD